MRYYSNDWVYTATSQGAKEVSASTKPIGSVGLAKGVTFLLPLLIVALASLFSRGGNDPQMATVLIVTESGTGAGSIVTSDGYILTNRQVVANTSRMSVIVGSGTQRQQTYTATLVQKNETSPPASTTNELLQQLPNEVAILKIQARGLAHFRLPESTLRLSPNIKVSAIGYNTKLLAGANGKGPSQDMPSGTISGFLPSTEDQRLITHTCNLPQGFNGSPLIDDSGTLLGINITNLPTDIGNNRQIAIPISAFKSALSIFTGSTH
ncbi:MAG: S1C family serine protease [Armatimonadetes bacterium]|nr:S1C family serine protease [Armatimonadota bacterium]